MNDFKRESFNLSRAFLRQTTHYPPATINTQRPLQAAVDSGVVMPFTPLLVMTLGEQSALAFVTLQLVYHHVIQGQLSDEPWLVSFCSICNGGAAFSPVVDGRIHHFSERGFYDAMVLLHDQETGSYWDHLQGTCLYGPSEGKMLRRLSNLLHMTAKQTLTAYPDALLAYSELSAPQQAEAAEDDEWRQEAQPEWSALITRTLDDEDPRLPRLEMGLGVWTGSTSRYYPASALYAQNNALIDRFNGRGLLVYLDADSGTPGAFYTDATHAYWEREALYLNNGERVRDGALIGRDGKVRRDVERPLQLFSRWYAFAVKFRGCDIYKG
ncbi:MAG: DUF3179 domain-containing protein [Anaerolineae bacterium]|jgi:hypothetical protein|nr:DUF3179 domain-containing protein [Anaerolineae bacterium]